MKLSRIIVVAGALLMLAAVALVVSHDAARKYPAERSVQAAVSANITSEAASPVSTPAALRPRAPESVASALPVDSQPDGAPRSHPTNSDRLVTESTLLLGSDLDSNSVGTLLQAEDAFDKALDQMADEMQRDPDAMALGDTYSQVIAAQLSSDSQALHLDRLSCGLRLCAASFDDVADEAAWEAWRQRFDADPETPHSVFVERSVARPDGSVERRVIFTTDPTSLGVNVRGG